MGESDIYRQLQQHIDKSVPVGLPPTESGVELRFLKRLFTPEEASLSLSLSGMPESLEDIHSRVRETGLSVEDLEKKLDILVQKGAVMGGSLTRGEKGEKRYCLMSFAIGMWEFQVNRLDPELVEMAGQYVQEAFHKAWFNPDTPTQMRTIPIEQSFTVDHHVSTYDNVRNIVENTEGPLAVLNCVCKQAMDVVDQPCKTTDLRECCITFENMAEYVIGAGSGREVTREEMFDLLQKFDDAGLVLQPENAQNPLFICACCGDCCGVLQMMKAFPRPADLYASNYIAVVDPEECTSCETCVERCQMDAISMVDEVSTVDLDRCIGCGLCVPTCPSEAMQLQKKEKELVPPKNSDELYQTIYMKRMGTA